jgi:hypothetical protein
MITGNRFNPLVELYNENFSDTDEKEEKFCNIDGDINLFNHLPTEEQSVEKQFIRK